MKKTMLCFLSLMAINAHADLLGEVSEKVDYVIKTEIPKLYNKISEGDNKLEGQTQSLRTDLNVVTRKDIPELKESLKKIQNKISIEKKIGDRYRGGVIFWLDENKEHGLIVALKDASTESFTWRNGTSGNKTTNARADGIFSGEPNTNLIIAEETIDEQKGKFAALIASQYKISEDGISPCNNDNNCYGSWYLPSSFELKLLSKNLNVSNLTSQSYWSSTESSFKTAWLLDVTNGEFKEEDKAQKANIRAISRF